MTTPPQSPQLSGRRELVLQALRDVDHPLGIAEIADRLGVHANTVRFHLDTLVGNGQVERTRAESGTPGRPRQLFRTVRGMDPMGPRHYRMLAGVLAVSLAAEPDPHRRGVEAGKEWGRVQASAFTDPIDVEESGPSVDRLTRMLDELGFAPEPLLDGTGSQIGLRSCPFLEVAVERSDVVCPVHLGLMRGAMESWGSPVSVERLEPFVEPDLCVVHLGT